MSNPSLEELSQKYRESVAQVDTLLTDDGQKHDVYRCRADGELVFNTQTSLARHAGHDMKTPLVLTDLEKEILARVSSLKELEEVIYAGSDGSAVNRS